MNELLNHIRRRLRACYPDGEADALAFLLLEQKYGLTRTDLYMGKGTHFSRNEQQELEEILERLCKMEPIQYVLGETEFCGGRFRVTGDVLIPRPETAELVAWITEENAELHSVLDIGTGSGCIAVSLARLLPTAEVEAWDVSAPALEVAAGNARLNGVRVRTVRHDILGESPEGCWEVVVSNPPYITPSERVEMEANVLEYEPHLALFVPQEDPLLFYRAIALYAREHLTPEGRLYFEINRAYGAETRALLEEVGFTDVEVRNDLFGNPRMARGVLKR